MTLIKKFLTRFLFLVWLVKSVRLSKEVLSTLRWDPQMRQGSRTQRFFVKLFALTASFSWPIFWLYFNLVVRPRNARLRAQFSDILGDAEEEDTTVEDVFAFFAFLDQLGNLGAEDSPFEFSNIGTDGFTDDPYPYGYPASLGGTEPFARPFEGVTILGPSIPRQ